VTIRNDGINIKIIAEVIGKLQAHTARLEITPTNQPPTGTEVIGGKA
jgi:hypothetical protein